MKVEIIISSGHYTLDQLKSIRGKVFTVEWDFPFLPNENDSIDIPSILGEDMPSFDEGDLMWRLEYLTYKRVNGSVTVLMFVYGE